MTRGEGAAQGCSFFCIVGIGLTLSSILGLWIGLTQTRSKRTAWTLVSVGTLLPVLLLLF